MRMRDRYLSGLLRRLLEESEQPAKVISARMGMPYSTLMNQLNGDIANAKFGADDLLDFCRALHTAEPVSYLAAGLGYRLEPLCARPDGRNLDHERTQATIAVAEFFKAQEQGTPADRTFPLLSKAIKELEDCHVRQAQEEQQATTCPEPSKEDI